MDKTGLIALIIGIVLWQSWRVRNLALLPDVIIAVKGLIGITVLGIGLMLVIFGILICKD